MNGKGGLLMIWFTLETAYWFLYKQFKTSVRVDGGLGVDVWNGLEGLSMFGLLFESGINIVLVVWSLILQF